jgi:hypothetical protein
LPASPAGREAEEERAQRSEEELEDDMRRQLAACLLGRETGLKPAFASFAKAWEEKKRKEEEKLTPTTVAKVIIPFKALARLARSIARRIYGGLTSRRPEPGGNERMVRPEDSDDDPAKKSGTGKILEEGTARSCGEEGEEVGWSEDAVEWCGVRYERRPAPLRRHWPSRYPFQVIIECCMELSNFI